MTGDVLLCWHAHRAGPTVMEHAVQALLDNGHPIEKVLCLVQADHRTSHIPASVKRAVVECIPIKISDPTDHRAIYDAIRGSVLPRLERLSVPLHINVSPGTPAMHAVWLLLEAGGAFPDGTRLWSTQRPDGKGATRLSSVEFGVSTWLSEFRAQERRAPKLAAYEPDARSPARRQALEQLARYARVRGAPLLIYGERGVGKTRLVEAHVCVLKGHKELTKLACGDVTTEKAPTLFFGNSATSSTGGVPKQKGLFERANGGILFLDGVHDLPRAAQRLLVGVLQGHRRIWRPLDQDEETEAEFDLVCTTNLSPRELEERLDPDFFDRISHLTVEFPPLRECPEDLAEDWRRVWREVNFARSGHAPWSDELERVLLSSDLTRNLRDLQRLAALIVAHLPNGAWTSKHIDAALRDWSDARTQNISEFGFGDGSRNERLKWFRRRLAIWAKSRFGTWSEAARYLKCDEKTLREDAK